MKAPCVLALCLVFQVPVLADSWTDYHYFSNGEVTPEGGNRNIGDCAGRTHVNGRVGVGWSPPIISGPFSQTEESIGNLAEYEYDAVFQGGWYMPHPGLIFPPTDQLPPLREQCLPLHHWAGLADSVALTTLIRFDGPIYHAAQYAESQQSGVDTLWHTPWTTLTLPGPAEPQLIWVEGVARVKGIVEGQVTLLASDSLFIMGDLITADTDTTHYTDPAQFGLAPEDSPYCIGLIGERDIIIAATLENGFANGQLTPQVNCGLLNHPVIWGGGQARRDVVIRASLLALGCSFETEFWRTTTWGATVPNISVQSFDCGGQNFTHVVVLGQEDCPGADAEDDKRGTLWYCGSRGMASVGFLIRSPGSPWGNAWIGYLEKLFRADPTLHRLSPPYWPDARWVDPSPLGITLNTGTASSCGQVNDPAAFFEEWMAGDVRLDFTNPGVPEGPDPDFEQLRIKVFLNDSLLESTEPTVAPYGTAHWQPSAQLLPGSSPQVNLHVEVERGLNWQAEGWFEVLHTWNEGGSVCSWTWNNVAVEDPAVASAFALSAPWPNPFNPVTQVELSLASTAEVTLEVHDLLGRREAVLHAGLLPAGTQTFEIDGSGWSAGLHLLTLRHAGGVETRKLLLLK